MKTTSTILFGTVLGLSLFFLIDCPVSAAEGNALFLDGIDNYASVADNPTLDLGTGGTDDFTIECWFYIPSDVAGDRLHTLIYKQTAFALFARISATGQDYLFFRLWTAPISTSYVTLQSPVNLAPGWHHAAAVFDNEFTSSQDMIALYLDGNLVASSTGVEVTPGIPNSSSALNIGAYLGVNPLYGWIDEVRLSDVVRYSGASYTIPTGALSTDANTRALWHFNEALGATSFADASANGNTLTGVNGAQTAIPPTSDTTPPTVTNVVDVTPDPRTSAVTNVDVIFSEPINLSTFTYQDVTLTRDGNPISLTTNVTTSLVSGTTYRIANLDAFTQIAGIYTVTVNASGIQDLAGNAGTGSGSDTWTLAQPALSIAASTNTIQISWPSWAEGYFLEETTDLDQPIWSSVTNMPVGAGDRNTIMLDNVGTNIFFRLRK